MKSCGCRTVSTFDPFSPGFERKTVICNFFPTISAGSRLKSFAPALERTMPCGSDGEKMLPFFVRTPLRRIMPGSTA